MGVGRRSLAGVAGRLRRRRFALGVALPLAGAVHHLEDLRLGRIDFSLVEQLGQLRTASHAVLSAIATPYVVQFPESTRRLQQLFHLQSSSVIHSSDIRSNIQ